MADAFASSGSVVINRCFKRHEERIGAYRVLRNQKVTCERLEEWLARDCAENAAGAEHVLCIEDTTSFSFHQIKGRLAPDDPDLGKGDNALLRHSFFCHPTLADDAESDDLYGFSSVILYNRSGFGKPLIDRHKRPLEEKESYRWAQSADKSRAVLEGKKVTMVADRECDAIDIISHFQRSGCGFLVRMNSNRKLSDSQDRIMSFIDSLPDSHSFSFNVPRSRKHSPHRAEMSLKFTKASIAKGKDETLECWCVSVRERAGTVPKGEAPIEWNLLTSHRVETVEDALRCVGWYRKRWQIEEMFRLLKTKGFGMEHVQLESGKTIKKLLYLAMYAATKIMRLKKGYDDRREDVSASEEFDSAEMKVLGTVMDGFEREPSRNKGNTNPYKRNSLVWAVWIVARLGGWSGYEKGHGRPGRITLKRGYDCLSVMVEYERIRGGCG